MARPHCSQQPPSSASAESYTVIHYGDNALIYDQSSMSLDKRALRQLIASLSKTLEFMESTGFEQEALLDRTLSVLLIDAWNAGRFHLGSTDRFMFRGTINRHVTPKRPPRNKQFKGVYFIRFSGGERVLKIGRTSDLYQRSRQIFLSNNRRPIELIAFWETEDDASLEQILHKRFEKYRDAGEWFLQEPIIAWLNDVLPGGVS